MENRYAIFVADIEHDWQSGRARAQVNRHHRGIDTFVDEAFRRQVHLINACHGGRQNGYAQFFADALDLVRANLGQPLRRN